MLFRSDCPGSTGRDIVHFATWILKVYEGNIRGLINAWSAVVGWVCNFSQGYVLLPAPEIAKLPLPDSICSPILTPHQFTMNTSSPAVLNGMPERVIIEVINATIGCLNSDFGFGFRSGDTAEGQITGTNSTGVLIFGAGNMRILGTKLRESGLTVTDFSVPGWFPTNDNIAALREDLKKVPESDSIIIEPWGNFIHRYVQQDGSKALPVK